jgi:hypothetical protein
MAVDLGTVVLAAGCVLVAGMAVWCVVRVRHWRRVAERAGEGGRCTAADLVPGDLVFVWAYVLEHGEWKHGVVAKVEHDVLDTDQVQLVRILLAEGASFTVKPIAPAWVLSAT